MSASAAAVPERILALLDAAGASYTLHEHVAVTTVEEARALVPALTENLLKTIAFEISNTPRRVLAAVAADADVDYKALAAALGCNRRALRLLPPARVEAELGFEVGGIGPFAVHEAIEVVIDDAIDPSMIVRCGGGLRTRTIELPIAALSNATRSLPASISKRPGTSGVQC